MKLLPVLFLGIALLVGCGDGNDDTQTLEQILEEALTDDEAQLRGPEGEELLIMPGYDALDAAFDHYRDHRTAALHLLTRTPPQCP